MMDAARTLVILLRCCVVFSLPPDDVVFSAGVQLLVHEEDEQTDHLHPHQSNTAGSGPSVQMFWSDSSSLDPDAPRLLVCVLSGLTSPLQDVTWWVRDTAMTSSDVSWTRPAGGGAYSAASVWEVPAADWRSGSTYWCGTTQEGRVYKQKLCSRD